MFATLLALLDECGFAHCSVTLFEGYSMCGLGAICAVAVGLCLFLSPAP